MPDEPLFNLIFMCAVPVAKAMKIVQWQNGPCGQAVRVRSNVPIKPRQQRLLPYYLDDFCPVILLK